MIQLRSYAKINWSLRITGKRADGFHDLETLFQQISLHDTLTFLPSNQLSLTCDDPTIPTGESNLIIRAARALGSPLVAIQLLKRIPAGGGLGGGSSNAAATLLALNEMFALGVTKERLHELALELGSDVPFFLVGGTAYATGRGELLQPVTPMSGIPLLLLLPDERVLTRDAFARVTRYSAPLGAAAYSDFTVFTNDFEEPVFTLVPRLRELKQRLRDHGAIWAQMSGSGSTIVGAFATPAERDHARAAFADVRCEPATS